MTTGNTLRTSQRRHEGARWNDDAGFSKHSSEAFTSHVPFHFRLQTQPPEGGAVATPLGQRDRRPLRVPATLGAQTRVHELSLHITSHSKGT